MARYTGPVCRFCRRGGEKLFLKGDRCFGDKCAIERRPQPAGMHGQRRGKESDYALHLKEKQKARRVYGILEKQFRIAYHAADRQKGGTGENLLQRLERRLDNVVYKLGFANSRSEARQMVRHKHFLLNGKRADIPSMLVKTEDVVSMVQKSAEKERFKSNIEASQRRVIPEWLELDSSKMKGRVKEMPNREAVDFALKENLIVEWYSR